MTKRILNEKEYWNMSYIITGDEENKISWRSLNNGTVRNEGIVVKWLGMERFFFAGILRSGSEKGCSRKRTKNRVTSWSFMYWGNLTVLR
jgi:hypothetical protein